MVLAKNFIRTQLQGPLGVISGDSRVPLPLCSCGVIPAGLGLNRRRSNGSAVAFLIATPQTGVDSILVSAGMLGVPFALFELRQQPLPGSSVAGLPMLSLQHRGYG